MFSMFRCSKLLLTKHLFFMPISEKTHYFSSLISTNDRSYTVNYLINSCGLSPESAESASKKVKFKNPERPDSVLELLKKYGFDKIHISVLARRFPVVLTFDSEKTLLPKLEFFKSIGVSDIGRVLSSNPSLLAISLENQMIPAYKFLKSLVGSDKKIVTICDRSSWVVYSRNTVPNITLLRELGVPSSSIELLVNHYTLSIIQNHKLFRVAVDKAKEMGFDPLKSTFVLAVRVLSAKSNKLIWNRCSEEYKRWGWSEEDILSAFKKQPSIMVLSEKKIRKTMGFLVNKFGCQSKSIAKFPSILYFSLEKRIIPRCSVIQALSLKGLIKEVRLISVMVQVEKRFLEKFVTKYEDQLPRLMNVYRGEVDMLAL